MNPSIPHVSLENSQISNSGFVASQDLWTTKDVAKYLHVSPKIVFNLRQKGLPFVQLGGAVRFVPQEIANYLHNSRRSSAHRLRQMIRHGEARP